MIEPERFQQHVPVAEADDRFGVFELCFQARRRRDDGSVRGALVGGEQLRRDRVAFERFRAFVELQGRRRDRFDASSL